MPISVHSVVLTIEQPFPFTDDRLPTSWPATGYRNWFKKQQKYPDQPFETGNVCYKGERPENGKASGY